MFTNINLLEKGMDASWLRNQAITNNIANVDTPGFKASSVEFEAAFKKALKDDGGFSAKTTRPKHYDFTDSGKDITPVVTKDTRTVYRMDENNVDIDYQNIELAKNTIYYNELATLMGSEIGKMKTVING
jgi:flagellar basal-body rod protein FlgB